MLGTLITVHGFIRWLLAALAILLIVRYAVGWLGKRDFVLLTVSLPWRMPR